MDFIDSLRNNRRYVGRSVAVFRGQVVACAKNSDKLFKTLLQLGGWELAGRSAVGFVRPPGQDYDECLVAA